MFSRGCEASAYSSISSGCAQVAEGCGFVSASNLSTQAISAPGTVFPLADHRKAFPLHWSGAALQATVLPRCCHLMLPTPLLNQVGRGYEIRWFADSTKPTLFAPHPYAGVSIQSTLSPWAGCSSGALSLHGAVGLAHSPGRNLKGQSAPPRSNRSILFRLLLLT